MVESVKKNTYFFLQNPKQVSSIIPRKWYYFLLVITSKQIFVRSNCTRKRKNIEIDRSELYPRSKRVDKGGRESRNAIGALQSGGCAQETSNRAFNEDKLN